MIRPALSILLIAWAVTAACSNDAGGTDESPGLGPVPPGSLIYIEGASLRSFDLGSRDTATLAELPSPDVAISPDGNRYVAVVETGAAVPDGYSKPELRIGATDGGDTTSLGRGRSPRWSPGGDQIAAVTPGPRIVDCPVNGGKCVSVRTERVSTYEPEADARPEPEHIIGYERAWSILSWADGDSVVAADPTGHLVIGRPGRSPEALAFTAAEVWGASPTAYELLIVQGRRTYFARPGVDVSPNLRLEGARLADGAWSPDGTRVASVLVTDTGTELGLVIVDSGAIARPEAGLDAQGQVVWHSSGDWFAFARVAADDAGKLEAVVCSVELECDALFRWRNGVRLLVFR